MDGKKLVIGMIAIVVVIGLITLVLYLLTRQDDVESDGESVTPNAVVEHVAPEQELILVS